MNLEHRIRELVEGFLLVEFPGASEDAANRAAVNVARRLAGRPGLLDAVPGARTLFLACDQRLDRSALEADLAEATVETAAAVAGRTVRIPVHYGGAAGLDLQDLARGVGVSPDEVVRRHAAASYRVAFLGFAPGFGYCVGLPEELHAPRLPTPRARVAAGTLAIGSRYTGVYPAETPGGWRLIGRSSARFFDPAAYPPTLLLPGDAVVYEPVGESAPALWSRDDSIAQSPEGAVRLFRVHSPGLFTSLQGAPRYGRGAFGVPAGGVMDPFALARGNEAVGNAAGAAALEITLAGPQLEVLADGRAAIAGVIEAEKNGTPLSAGRPFELARGDRLRLARVTAGVRAYLCVAGGFAIEPLQWQTRRLAAQDVLYRDESRAIQPASGSTGEASAEGVVRVVLGPQEDRFGQRGVAGLFSRPWRVSASSDRRGVRLEGEPLRHEGSAEIEPEGTAPGAIQVPLDGQPIVLGPDRPVTGGYAKIATVVAADWPLIAQAGPTAVVRFRAF